MKKLTRGMALLLAVVFLFAGLGSSAAFAASPARNTNVNVFVNGTKVSFDVKPFIDTKLNRTYVPIRFVVDHLGGKTTWTTGSTSIGITTKAGTKITLTAGSKTVYVAGTKGTIDAAPLLENGRVLVPLRFISETLGATVNVTTSNGWTAISILTDGQSGTTTPPSGGGTTTPPSGGGTPYVPGDNHDLGDSFFPPLKVVDGYLQAEIPTVSGYEIYATYASATTPDTKLTAGKTYKFKVGDSYGSLYIAARPLKSNDWVEAYSVYVDKNDKRVSSKWAKYASGSDVLVYDSNGDQYVTLDAVVEALSKLK